MAADRAKKALKNADSLTAKEAELVALLEEQRRTNARLSMIEFTRFTFPTFRENWHHTTICSYLDRLVSGDIKRLMIFAPPRHTKSELVSRRLPAFALGRNPDEQIISCSYSDDLASRMNRDVQRIIDSEQYEELFPDSRLFGKNIRAVGNGSWLRNSDIFEIVGRRGVYRSAGIGGGITGMGATLGIIDDPIKNQKEAQSLTIRQAHWEWYTTTFATRLQKDARVLLTLTRWHEDDLAGRLLDLAAKDGTQWTVLVLPAVAEGNLVEADPRQAGELLWPSEFGAVHMREQRTNLGEMMFSAVFQQRPAPAEGHLVKREWWRYYDRVPDDLEKVIMSWDLTFTDGEKSDMVAAVVLGKKGADVYVLDLINDKLSFTRTLAAITTLAEKWPKATAKYVEKAANGFATLDYLKSKVPGLIGVTPRGSKEDRVSAISPRIEAGNIHLPSKDAAPWADLIVEQFAAFPNVKHDDICFVAGTMVETPTGKKSIESLMVGDRVITPFGIDTITQRFSRMAETIESCGLEGTPDHPVFCYEKGFERLDAIRYNTISRFTTKEILRWKYKGLLCSMGSPTGSWERELTTLANRLQMKDEGLAKDFMSRFGSFIRGKEFLKGGVFTTRTAITLITTLAILSACHTGNIARYTLTLLKDLKNKKSTLNQSDRRQPNGIDRKKVESGTASTESGVRRKGKISASISAVMSAARHSSRKESGQNTVQEGADRRLTPIEKMVFNIKTKRFHVYYANGILVHNCDAMTQGISKLYSEKRTYDIEPLSILGVNQWNIGSSSY